LAVRQKNTVGDEKKKGKNPSGSREKMRQRFLHPWEKGGRKEGEQNLSSPDDGEKRRFAKEKKFPLPQEEKEASKEMRMSPRAAKKNDPFPRGRGRTALEEKRGGLGSHTSDRPRM